MKRILLSLAVLLAPLCADAQFYSQGSDPGNLRWYSVETPYYKIIYPEGADSLAVLYGTLLEQFRPAVGRSLGVENGASQWGKTPVVLHTHYGYPNGSMFWAPSRMDIFTVQDPYGADPSPWAEQLTTHEPRHQAQFQPAYQDGWRWLNWLVGEMWPGAFWGVYIGQALGEGDAVAVETALSSGARTRTAEFLNYFRVAVDSAETRNWYQWRYGSFKKFSPDHYPLGYITVAGMRVFHNQPSFMADYVDYSRRHPFHVGNLQKMMRDASGKSFNDAFQDILHSFDSLVWQPDAAFRAPFMPMERVSEKGSFACEFNGLACLDSLVYALRESYDRPRELVALHPDGSFEIIRPFAVHTSGLFAEPESGRLYWSESVGDVRWELAHTSRIMYLEHGSHRARTLTTEGRLYLPHPNADGSLLACVEYPYGGGSAVSLVDAVSGEIVGSYPAPFEMQLCGAAWCDGEIYVSALTHGGYGIYRLLEDGSYEGVLMPSVQKIINLGDGEGFIEWESDRTGVCELYRYYVEDGRLVQLSATPYGASEFCEAGERMFYVSQQPDGLAMMSTPLADMVERPAVWSAVRPTPVEDVITAQEAALGPLRDSFPVSFSEPRRYRKLGHMLRLHSWAPLYFDYDELESMSMDFSFSAAAPGATLLFQNDLGTLTGSLGYAVYPELSDWTVWHNAVHTKFTYTGLYPVIEARFDAGGEQANQYLFCELTSPMGVRVANTSYRRDAPSVSGSLSMYLPLRFNSHGFIRGIIPRVSWGVSNSFYGAYPLRYTAPLFFEDLPAFYRLSGKGDGNNYLMQSLSFQLRAYSSLPTATSGIFPRLGIGAELGGMLRPGLGNAYPPSVYGYLYGYLPGFVLPQGLRLTALYTRQFRQAGDLSFGELFASALPRGFSSGAAYNLAQAAPSQLRVTADYAIPIYVGDLSFLSPVVYIKNFLLTPHADLCTFNGGRLWSAGTDLSAHIANLAWLPFDGSVGVSWSWLGGSIPADAWEAFTGSGSHQSFSLIFSMDF